jgi:hypothetical protein
MDNNINISGLVNDIIFFQQARNVPAACGTPPGNCREITGKNALSRQPPVT